MKKLSLFLSIVLLISIFSACGKTENPASTENTAEAAPTTEPSAEPTTVPVDDPSPAPTEEATDAETEEVTVSPHWDIESIAAPAVPLDGTGSPDGMVPLKEVPVEYNWEQAVSDGCFVNVHTGYTNKTHNTTTYKNFIDAANSGTAGKIRIVHDYTSDYGTYIVKDVEFDGNRYIVRQYIREDDTQAEYESVKVYERVNDNLDELFPLYTDAVEAAVDGCEVRDEYETVLYGEDALADFYNKVKNGEKALFRRAYAYSSSQDITISLHIEFDGQYFISKEYEERNMAVVSVIYPYMVETPSVNLTSLSTDTFTILAYSEKHSYSDLVNKTREAFNSGFFETVPYYEYLSMTQEPLPREILDDTDWVPEDESHLSDKAREYTVLPGTDEWAALEQNERIASCALTQDEVENITTGALLETALTYPYLVNIYAYNTLDIGIELQQDHNLALKELFTRKNAYYEMILLCAQIDSVSFGEEYNDNEHAIQKMALESIIGYFERHLLTEENNPWPHLID